MKTGERIREYRKLRKLTQQELGDAVGLAANTVSDIERGKYALSADLLGPVSFALGILPTDLLDVAEGSPSVHDWGRPLLVAYMEAPEPTQENVCKLLDIPRVNPTAAKQTKQKEVDMLVYWFPAAAGVPLYADADFEHISFPEDEVPAGADFGIRISGDSMEPTIKDGSIVWVHKQVDICDGGIGVFMLGDSAVCKRTRCTPDGRITALESDNEKYEPIKGSDLEGLRLVGRVLI